MRGLCAILAAAMLAAGVAAPAAASDDDWPELKAKRLNDTPPDMAFAVYRYAAEVGGPITGVSLWAASPPGAPAHNPRIVARRVDSEKGRVRIRWADTADCPALSKALDALDTLSPPRLVRPGRPNPDGDLRLTTGDDYLIWTNDARWSRHSDMTQSEIRAGGDTPLQAWIDGALASTDRCWRAEAPAFP
jgi:hypothetical protein